MEMQIGYKERMELKRVAALVDRRKQRVTEEEECDVACRKGLEQGGGN